MDAGVIGIVHGDFDEINLDQFPLIHTESGDELRSTVNVETVREHKGEHEILTGVAAEQMRSESPTSTIDEDGNVVDLGNEVQISTDYTEFICDPGEFVIVENSMKEYAFDLIGRATETAIEPVTFDLDSFIDLHPDAQLWMGGFYDHTGSAQTGVAYGDSILEDPDLGPIITDSKKNQIGVVIEHETEPVKMQLTESGYVNIYQPSEFGPLSLARLVREELLDHANNENEVN